MISPCSTGSTGTSEMPARRPFPAIILLALRWTGIGSLYVYAIDHEVPAAPRPLVPIEYFTGNGDLQDSFCHLWFSFPLLPSFLHRYARCTVPRPFLVIIRILCALRMHLFSAFLKDVRKKNFIPRYEKISFIPMIFSGYQTRQLCTRT